MFRSLAKVLQLFSNRTSSPCANEMGVDTTFAQVESALEESIERKFLSMQASTEKRFDRMERRIAMKLDQVNDAVVAFDSNLRAMATASASSHSDIVIRESVLVGILDQLSKANSFQRGSENELARRSIERVQMALEEEAMLTPVTSIGAVPHATHEGSREYEVLGVISSPSNLPDAEISLRNGVEPGSVVEIVQQGYRRRDGTLLRGAKVIVASVHNDQPNYNAQQFEQTDEEILGN